MCAGAQDPLCVGDLDHWEAVMIAAKLCGTAQKGPRKTLTPLLVILLLIISTRSRGILFREIAFTTMIVGDQVYILRVQILRLMKKA